MSNEKARFPLGQHHRAGIRTKSGKPLLDLTLDNVQAQSVGPDDVSIHADTLAQQAEFSASGGCVS